LEILTRATLSTNLWFYNVISISRVGNNETAQGDDHKFMKKFCIKIKSFLQAYSTKMQYLWQKHVPENNEILTKSINKNS
jgi:hypothetical protein